MTFSDLLLGQCIQLLDVRRDERVKSDQNLVHRQGGQEETQSLHQPHALAALHTDTQGHTTGHIIHDVPHRDGWRRQNRVEVAIVEGCLLTLWISFTSTS